ncbi:ribonuclease H-like YkuK family protein [Croceimicrobium sp.]|uniref:ribonuclease H-like YkuK family protein n=1 Tax=Croceimicrobium sp. TaxID=2828340 RepID=UPI003BA8EAB4
MRAIPNPVFRSSDNKVITEPRAYVAQWLKMHPRGKVFVGCDSKVRGHHTKYSTAICMWDIGRGVSEIYKNEVVQTPPDQYTRLWTEVEKAVAVASELKGLTSITVHVDINSNPRFRSHQLYDASIGLISAMGFEGAGKPHSWAASCGAHRHCQ